jgi:transposase
MSTSDAINNLSRADLIELVVTLQRQVAELSAQVGKLQAENDLLKRQQARQAAPFSKGKRVHKPKRPGRHPGSGHFCYRHAPTLEYLSGAPVDVPVTAIACPRCGGSLQPERTDWAYQTDLPPLPRPVVMAYRVAVCRCVLCGQQVRGHHPEVAPDQYGATAHRVGNRVMALAHALHYGLGLPVRKVPAVLRLLSGIQITQSALTQDALRRLPGDLGARYEQLRARVAERPVVHTDDTGWRVGGEPAYLMAFETDEATVYQIRAQHRHDEVAEVIPPDYKGVMATDRGRSYDAHAFAAVKQQKCLSHILRNISDVLERQRGRRRLFGERLQTLLREAIALWHVYHAGAVATFAEQAQRLHKAITRQLRPRGLRDPDNQRLLDGIGWHHDRGNLLRFLDDPAIEPTNNRAERSLRGPVIARKVSQCSKTPRGAEAFAAFSSVIKTMAKSGLEVMVEELCEMFHGAGLQRASPL